jgi:hypothetical protein
MKRLTAIKSGLLVVAFALGGCGHMLYSEGWVNLFDGKNLDNFTPVGGANWSIVDGVLQADKSTTKGSSFLLSKNSYKDFEIRVEFWVSDDANSGIYMRCSDRNKLLDTTCYEANIFDQRPDPSFGTGAVVHIAPVSPMPKAGGRWNLYEITARGNEITVVLNGQRTVIAYDSKFASGPIALQYGKGVVKFRRLDIKPL